MFLKPFLLSIIEVLRFLNIKNDSEIDVWSYGFRINMRRR